MSYTTISTLCTIALLTCILCLTENEIFSRKKKYRFISIAIIIFVEICIDTLALLIDGSTKRIDIYKGIKIIEFIIAPLIPTILSRLVAHKSYWKKINKYFIFIIVINAIAQIATFFVPIMFKINQNGEYERTIFTYFYAMSMVVCFILLIVASKNTYVQNTATTNLTLISINLLFFVGMVVRVNNIHSNADWLCITFGYFIFIVYYSNNYLKIDPITFLANRRAFNSKISHINYSTAIIVIDANNFKNINDSYGHECGDMALLKIAEAIFEVYNKIGYCYRTGGDEFTVILKKNMLKRLTIQTENCDTYRMIYNLISNLNEKIKEMSEEYHMVRFGVSQGFGIYFSPAEKPTLDEHKTIEEVIKFADERMYKDKLKFKQEHKNSAF